MSDEREAKALPPERFHNAWIVPGSSIEYGVLLEFEGYWWLICPADATLFVGEVDNDCHDATCDWEPIHIAAVDIAHRLTAPLPEVSS